MAGTDQNTHPTSHIMDARKFLRAINTGAQAKVVFFEESIRKMGKKVDKNYRLTSLDANSLIFEDVDSNSYHIADIAKKDRGRIAIDNIRPIKVVDEQKSESFGKHCADLVENLSSDNFKDAERVFKIIESQRFRPSVIPESGWVTTKDQNAHHVALECESDNYDLKAISEAFCTAVSEFVELDDSGKIIRGEFPETGQKFDIPINEMTKRRLVANHMKAVAEGAWKSDTFRKMTGNIAGMVSTGDIKEAIQVAAKFFKESQEFGLLTFDETVVLVENALSSVGQFNSVLAEHSAELMYKVNIKVNRGDICDSWRKTALKAENSELLHNIKLLEDSKNFSDDYGKFLGTVFNEGLDVQTARAKAYLTTLKVINSILTKMEGKEDLATQVENMVAELEEPEPSTDIIMEAEQLLCSIPDTLVDRIATLENYTEMPGFEAEAADLGTPDEPKGPAVSLPSGPEEEEELPPLPEEGEEEEEELPPLPEDKQKTDRVHIENMTVAQLSNELDRWKTDGHIFLKEDGFDDCSLQFSRYLKRCEELDAKDLREQFEGLRDTMVETGDDVIDDTAVVAEDPYAGADTGKATEISEEYGAKMDSPKGSGIAAKSGSEPGAAGKGSAAKGSPKMDSPKGKGVPAKGTSEQDVSPGGENPRMDQPGKGVQKQGLGDVGVSAENEKDPDDGKPSTGSAEMDSPEGKSVAESAGAPEKVKPGTGKQLKGKWLQGLDEKIATELKSGDQGDDLSKTKHPAQKGGLAEGEVPEAFKKNWGKGKGKGKGKNDDDKDDKKDTDLDDDTTKGCDTPGEKKRSGGEGRGLGTGEGEGPIGGGPGCGQGRGPGPGPGRGQGRPWDTKTEDIAKILQPYMEGAELNAETIANAILKLKEAAKRDEALKESVKLIESYYIAETPEEVKILDALLPYHGEGDITEDSLKEAIVKMRAAAEKDGSLKESLEALEKLNVEAILEAQYKFGSKGIKPRGFKRAALSEDETTEEDIAEGVSAVVLANDDQIDNVIAAVVDSMDNAGDVGDVGDVDDIADVTDVADEISDEVEGASVEPPVGDASADEGGIEDLATDEGGEEEEEETTFPPETEEETEEEETEEE